jgi:prevent-host-death family protein
MTTMSSRQFNQHTGEAKKAAESGPVLITDRGRTTHVLLNFEDFERMRKPGKTLYESFAHLESADYDFEIPEMKGDGD